MKNTDDFPNKVSTKLSEEMRGQLIALFCPVPWLKSGKQALSQVCLHVMRAGQQPFSSLPQLCSLMKPHCRDLTHPGGGQGWGGWGAAGVVERAWEILDGCPNSTSHGLCDLEHVMYDVSAVSCELVMSLNSMARDPECSNPANGSPKGERPWDSNRTLYLVV